MKGAKYTLVWVFWLIAFPTSLWFAYQISPPEIHMREAVIFTLMAAAIACMPLIINGTTLFLSHWITIAAFLSYGLFFEMVLLQFATVIVMFAIKLRRHELYRYFLNSSMLFITSLIAGLGFFAVGGQTGFSTLEELFIPITIYQLLYFLVNQILLYFVSIIMGKKQRFFGKDFVWEAILLLVVFPLGISLFYLNEFMGPISVLLIGVPFISFAFVLRMYNSTEKINDNLQKAVEIGHQLTERLQVKEVMDLFIQKISQTLPVDYAYILDVQEDELVMLRQMENGEQRFDDIVPLKKSEGISGYVWETGKGLIYHEKKDWNHYAQGYIPALAESVMCVPIIRSQKVEGVLFLATTRKKAYEKFQLMIVDILCSYFAVALVNARHYEETKRNSERCALTKLYNYRYFEEYLSSKMSALHSGKCKKISLIMLDIDHFKQINDTYGHQAGNEILAKMATRLSDLIGTRGTLARYGGEEFVILLPDTDQQIALRIAENVRQTIANRPFTVQNELDPSLGFAEVNITVSIGVSTAPEDADDAMSLIRHADRALYIGAKRAGRNRVAEYVKI
ncbi:MAG TPA: sensor domain-containing diguanylate cyclase [Bacillaceae bacterium]